MRRGLISWSKAELPDAVLDARVTGVQRAMAKAGLDALAVYTTPARAAGVSWLAGFVPYWNEGLLVVPGDGRPVLISALSNRVRDWIARNANVAEVRNAPLIGAEAGRLLNSTKASSAVGVVDLADIPARVSGGLVEAGHVVSDSSEILAGQRAAADPAELALASRAAAIAHRALGLLTGAETDGGEVVAKLDGEARRLGAEEVYPALAADLARSPVLRRLEGDVVLGEMWVVRLSVSYKGAWVRLTRTIDRGTSNAATGMRAAEMLASAIAELPTTKTLARFPRWLVEATRTTMPLEPLAGSMMDDTTRIPAGGIANVEATIELDGRLVLVGAPVLVGRAGESSALLLPPVW
jgi:Xaa-Pro aminopeptidase